MTRTQGVLLDILTPVRDIFLSRLLEEMADALEKGFDCETDVIRRTEDNEIARLGTLSLPERYDLATQMRGRTATYDVEDSLIVTFDQMDTTLTNGAPVSIVPFQWNSLHLLVELGKGQPDWLPLRRWYLEAFQSRFDEDTPEFHGVIHSLTGPEKTKSGWRFSIDLGTANVDCLADLLEALSKIDAKRVVLSGAEHDRELADG